VRTELGVQELARARRAGHLEPDGTAAGLDGELEPEEGAAPALEVDERRQHREGLRRGREAEPDTVRQPARLLGAPAHVGEHARPALGQLGLGQAAGDGEVRHRSA
jgi:hypothetical protein